MNYAPHSTLLSTFLNYSKDDLAGKLNDEEYKYIRYIFDSGEHLLALINDILDRSKVEAGMISLNLDVLSLDTLLHDSFSMIKEKSAMQRIELKEQIITYYQI
jgi:two-component system cell cycle sensor histidine kinase PleC